MWDLCPSRAWTSHGSAVPSLDPSSISASLIDLPVTHEHPLNNGHDDADFNVTLPFRTRSRLMCVPSLDPPQLSGRQSLVTRKTVLRLLLLR